jgi:hypothetical protein
MCKYKKAKELIRSACCALDVDDLMRFFAFSQSTDLHILVHITNPTSPEALDILVQMKGGLAKLKMDEILTRSTGISM